MPPQGVELNLVLLRGHQTALDLDQMVDPSTLVLELDHLVPCVTGLIEVPQCTILAIGTRRHLDQAVGGLVHVNALLLSFASLLENVNVRRRRSLRDPIVDL